MLFFYIFFHFIYGVDFNYDIKPDTIFAGDIATIKFYTTKLEINDSPRFSKIIEDTSFSIINYNLDKESALYTIQFWDPGTVIIPSIKIQILSKKKIKKEFQSKPIKLHIFSNLSDEDRALKPNKPMKEITFINKKKILLSILTIIILVIITIYFYTILKKTKNSENNIYIKQINFHNEALRKIKSIKIPQDNNTSSIETFYFKMSFQIKNYLKNILFIRATEMTSREITNYLEKNHFDQKLIEAWSKINYKNDKGKFSKIPYNINSFKEDKKAFLHLLNMLEEEVSKKS